MTRESNSVLSSSSTSTGTLFRGLSLDTPVSAFHGLSSTNSYSIFFSARTMRALRT